MAKDIYERNYSKLQEIAPQIIDGSANYMELKADGFMDLTVERLYSDTQNRDIVSLTHYKQDDRSMKDPNMKVRIDHEMKSVEALSFEQDHSIFTEHKEVYPYGDNGNTQFKEELNEFLDQWLTNIKNQGHVPYMINGEPVQENQTESQEPEQNNDMDMNM